MIDNMQHDKCTGCEACASACPVECISMVMDNEGFKVPEIDNSKCIKCGKCTKICPVLNFSNNHKENVDEKKAFAFKASNEKYRKICSSGGAFLTIAADFIKCGGVVYGAAFDTNFKLSHKRASSFEELEGLAGSKYLQSDILDTYKNVKKDLQADVKVLFVGMTCQVEGLKAYLGKAYEYLYCIDLICMGIPSPGVWNKYLELNYPSETIRRINFKDKSLGWHSFSFRVDRNDGSVDSIPGFDNYYMECMFKGYTIRRSCFNCPYKCENKISDLTIADCWGCENYLPEMDDNRGLSMVISHNEMGRDLTYILENNGMLVEFDYENVKKYNSYYNNTVSMNSRRSLFYKCLKISSRLAFFIMGQNPRKSNKRIMYELITKRRNSNG